MSARIVHVGAALSQNDVGKKKLFSAARKSCFGASYLVGRKIPAQLSRPELPAKSQENLSDELLQGTQG